MASDKDNILVCEFYFWPSQKTTNKPKGTVTKDRVLY